MAMMKCLSKGTELRMWYRTITMWSYCHIQINALWMEILDYSVGDRVCSLRSSTITHGKELIWQEHPFIPSTTKLIFDLFFCAAFQFLFPAHFLNKPIISYIHVTEDKTELTFIHLL